MRTKSNARSNGSTGKRSTKKTTSTSRSRTKGSVNSAEEQTGRSAGSKSQTGTTTKSRSGQGSTSRSSGSSSRSQGSSRRQTGRRESEQEGFLGRLASKVGIGDEPQDGLMKLMQSMLQDIYWAEKHLVKSMPDMIEAAQSDLLIDALEDHLEETEEQVIRLEEVFHLLDLRPKGRKCEVMQGLVDEANEAISEFEEGPVRDAAIIIAAQKVEHYEIASYGSLRSIADLLQMDEVVDLLQETLDEEGETDKILNEIAMDINEEAYRETYA